MRRAQARSLLASVHSSAFPLVQCAQMILDRSERFLVSSLGWVEHGGFVVRDLSTGKLAYFPGEEDAWTRLFAIDGDRFLAVVRARGIGRLDLAVRQFTAPATVLWSMRITPSEQEVSGDRRAAAGIQPHHLATFKNGGRWDDYLVTVAPDGSSAAFSAIPWYNAETYDLGYEGLTDAAALPGTALVLVSVQRSSTIIVHDPTRACEVGRFDLAGRQGNPMLTVVGNELWTIDYDTFVRVNLSTQRVAGTVRLQPAPQGTMQFAGELFVWAAQRKAVIPRPFSGDVAVIDPVAGRIKCKAPLGRQPLSCVVTANGRVIARDWKSGAWIEGNIPTNPRPWWRIW
jgi:hypothetical protein